MAKIPTISFTDFCERPATQADVDEQNEWLAAHPTSVCKPIQLGEMIDAEDHHQLPGRYEICDNCEGTGGSSAYLGAITQEERERDWDPEEFETYMDGGYDRTCEDCKGTGKVVVVDEEKCDKQLFARYEEVMRELAQERYNDRRTRWAEDGGRGNLEDY